MKDAGIWMSRTQLAFNSGDLVFQEIITSRPYHNSATRVVSLNAVWPVTATFPSARHYRPLEISGSARVAIPLSFTSNEMALLASDFSP